MASSATPVHEPAPASETAQRPSSQSPAARPRLPEDVAARLAAWEAAEELRRAREDEEAAAVAEAAEAARAARALHRRAPGGQKSCASIATASKHHGLEKSRPDPNRPRGQTERFRLRHGASPEEMLRDYRRLVTYPRQCPVLRAQLVLRSRPLSVEQSQSSVCSRYRQAAAEFQHSAGTSTKGDVVVVSTAPAVTDFRNPPKQGASRLQPPRWDRWLASRHPPERDDAALVPAPVHMPPLPGEASGTSIWAAIGARDSWTSFKLDSPPPARSSAARAPQQQPPQLQSGRHAAQPLPVRPPPPPPPPPTRVSTRLDLESCLSVVSLQAPDIAPAYRPRPQPPPPQRFEMVRSVTTGDSPAAGLSVAPVAQACRLPVARSRSRQSPPQARQPEPTHSEPTSPSASPTSSRSVPSSHSAPTSPHSKQRQSRR